MHMKKIKTLSLNSALKVALHVLKENIKAWKSD